MTNKEAIEELESLIEHCSSFVEHKHHEPWESDIEALKLGIRALKRMECKDIQDTCRDCCGCFVDFEEERREEE